MNKLATAFKEGSIAEAIEILKENKNSFFQKEGEVYPFSLIPNDCPISQEQNKQLLKLLKKIDKKKLSKEDRDFLQSSLDKVTDKYENRFVGIGLDNLCGNGIALTKNAFGGEKNRIEGLVTDSGKPLDIYNYYLQGEDVGELTKRGLSKSGKENQFIGALDETVLETVLKEQMQTLNNPGDRVLFAFNRGGNHWVAGMVVRTEDNKLNLLVEDTMADPENKVPSALKRFAKENGVGIIKNNTARQQTEDYYTCGDRTIQNIIRFSKLDLPACNDAKESGYVSPPMKLVPRKEMQIQLRVWKGEQAAKEEKIETQKHKSTNRVRGELRTICDVNGAFELIRDRLVQHPSDGDKVQLSAFYGDQDGQDVLTAMAKELAEKGVGVILRQEFYADKARFDLVLEVDKKGVSEQYEYKLGKTVEMSEKKEVSSAASPVERNLQPKKRESNKTYDQSTSSSDEKKIKEASKDAVPLGKEEQYFTKLFFEGKKMAAIGKKMAEKYPNLDQEERGGVIKKLQSRCGEEGLFQNEDKERIERAGEEWNKSAKSLQENIKESVERVSPRKNEVEQQEHTKKTEKSFPKKSIESELWVGANAIKSKLGSRQENLASWAKLMVKNHSDLGKNEIDAFVSKVATARPEFRKEVEEIGLAWKEQVQKEPSVLEGKGEPETKRLMHDQTKNEDKRQTNPHKGGGPNKTTQRLGSVQITV